MITQKWIVFDEDATQSQIDFFLNLNKDVCGYFHGIPPRLQWQANEENWTLPHIWIEEISNDQ